MGWDFWDFAFIPLFLLALLGAKVLPEWIGWKIEERKMNRLFNKRCLECNYDLRGSDHLEHCPECGAKNHRKPSFRDPSTLPADQREKQGD